MLLAWTLVQIGYRLTAWGTVFLSESDFLQLGPLWGLALYLTDIRGLGCFSLAIPIVDVRLVLPIFSMWCRPNWLNVVRPFAMAEFSNRGVVLATHVCLAQEYKHTPTWDSIVLYGGRRTVLLDFCTEDPVLYLCWYRKRALPAYTIRILRLAIWSCPYIHTFWLSRYQHD